MPRVLKRGRHEGNYVVGIYTCTGSGNDHHGCGAKLEVYFEDLYRTFHTDYSGDRECFVTFQCPQCSSETDIKDSGVRETSLPSKADFPAYVAKMRVIRRLEECCKNSLFDWEMVECNLDRILPPTNPTTNSTNPSTEKSSDSE